jgi:hypothetical protein
MGAVVSSWGNQCRTSHFRIRIRRGAAKGAGKEAVAVGEGCDLEVCIDYGGCGWWVVAVGEMEVIFMSMILYYIYNQCYFNEEFKVSTIKDKSQCHCSVLHIN